MVKISQVKRRVSTMSVRIKGEKNRKKLILADTAKAQARRKQTLLIKGETELRAGMTDRGEALKQGILGMADRSLIPDSVYAKLERMDPAKLDALYQNNDIIFEVYFDYGGIEKDEGAYHVDTTKKLSDTQFLIEQYERIYGPMDV